MSSQQVVLVTGSKSGFGRGIVETLARQGHRVFASLRDVDGRNAAYANALRDFAQREQLALSVLELDVTNETSANQAVEAVIEQAGHIDVLVNNAGVSYIGITEGYTLEQARTIMEVNFFGPLHLDRAVLPYMRQQRNGLLLHITSVSGGLAFPFVSLYSASKMALEALAEGYHYELAPLGSEAARISSSVAGGSKLKRGLMFRHMVCSFIGLFQNLATKSEEASISSVSVSVSERSYQPAVV